MNETAHALTERMKGRDWLMTQDWSDQEIELALDTAEQLKDEFRSGVPTLHLAHKTAFSLLALLLFGILVAGRLFAGWRGKRAVYLYLWGFAFLCVAYFGARYVLEELLNRSWG